MSRIQKSIIMEYFCICFGRLAASFFQVVLFYLAHIKDQHLKIHLLVIAPQGSDESPDNIRQHGAADTVLEVEQCIFIVARLHVRNGGIQLLP